MHRASRVGAPRLKCENAYHVPKYRRPVIKLKANAQILALLAPAPSFRISVQTVLSRAEAHRGVCVTCPVCWHSHRYSRPLVQ